ncbi:VanW family protein [Metabacillus litoralis]|uniref:VanW family protein n=1 Tax=Metabacillus litoralis TaxID=152268 RepID=UPI001CFE1FD1|nr:VanW family protein [Metabacillus litoralis]
MYFFLSIFLSLQFMQPVNLSEKILITHEGEEIKTVNRSDFQLHPIANYLIDKQKLIELTEYVNSKVYKAPIDAYLNEQNQLISEEKGSKLNQEKFKMKFYQSFFSNGSVTINIPIQTLYPRVDSELLSSIKTKQISYYITYFNSRNKQRSQNIQLASEAINNHVVFPGEIFSFNSVVGNRTVEKGYLPAPIIVKGELSEGVGGGICQVSSTLFNAVDRAGVKIIERYSHSRQVPYVPPNRDATVSWYGPDFTFKNQHNQPLLIRSKVIGGRLVITIFSSDVIETTKKNIPSAPQKLPKEVVDM